MKKVDSCPPGTVRMAMTLGHVESQGGIVHYNKSPTFFIFMI